MCYVTLYIFVCNMQNTDIFCLAVMCTVLCNTLCIYFLITNAFICNMQKTGTYLWFIFSAINIISRLCMIGEVNLISIAPFFFRPFLIYEIYLQEAYVKALGRGFSGSPFKTFTIRSVAVSKESICLFESSSFEVFDRLWTFRNQYIIWILSSSLCCLWIMLLSYSNKFLLSEK